MKATAFSRARWIGPAELDGAPDVYFYAAGFFELTSPPESAELLIAADSYYQVFLNGFEVGVSFARGSQTLLCFDRFEVARLLRPGTNVLAALVNSPLKDNFVRTPERPALIAEIPGIAATGPEWRIAAAPDFRRAAMDYNFQLGFVEDRDFRLEPRGWRSGAPEIFCSRAAVLPDDCPLVKKPLIDPGIPSPRRGVLRPVRVSGWNSVGPEAPEKYPRRSIMLTDEACRPLAPERITGHNALFEASPESLVIAPSGAPAGGVSLTLDFGTSVAARLAVDIDAPEGTIVDVIYAEAAANDDGRTRADRRTTQPKYNFTDHYILREGGNRVGSPFFRRGFRLAQLVVRNFARPVSLLSATAEFAEYPFVQRGDFNTPDQLFNRIWSLSVATLCRCTTDIFTDCVWREQSFWINDLVVENATSLAAFGATAVHRRAFELLFSQQREDALLPGVCPAPRGTAAQSIVLLPTNLFTAIMLNDYLMASGDEETVRRHLPGLRRILEYFETLADDSGVLTSPPEIWNFHDWSFELNHYSFNGCRESMLNFLYSGALRLYVGMCRSCRVECGDAAVLLARARRTALAAEREFVSPGSGYLVDNVLYDNKPARISSQLAHAYALLFGEPDGAHRRRFLEALTDPELLEPELYLDFFIFRAMLDSGDDRLIAAGVERLRKHWGRCVAAGLPTLPEAAVHQFGHTAFGGAGSMCHGFASAPLEFFQRAILGVAPLEPGFRKFSLRPRLGELEFASGRIPTPVGEIVLNCRRCDAGTEVEADIPAGLYAVAENEPPFSGRRRLVLPPVGRR